MLLHIRQQPPIPRVPRISEPQQHRAQTLAEHRHVHAAAVHHQPIAQHGARVQRLPRAPRLRRRRLQPLLQLLVLLNHCRQHAQRRVKRACVDRCAAAAAFLVVARRRRRRAHGQQHVPIRLVASHTRRAAGHLQDHVVRLARRGQHDQIDVRRVDARREEVGVGHHRPRRRARPLERRRARPRRHATPHALHRHRLVYQRRQQPLQRGTEAPRCRHGRVK